MRGERNSCYTDVIEDSLPADMRITFIGATGTVTGSKYLVEGSGMLLVDCGLFQGYKQLRLRNRAAFPVEPRALDAVVLTHAHLDHSGYLPLLVKNGYRGKVYCTEATADLCRIMLPDSGRLQEEEAEYANRRGFSKHAPALPLYTADDAERALAQLVPVDFRRATPLGKSLHVEFLPAGHILGAAMVRIADGDKTLLFSGDLGRPHDPIMHAPVAVEQADFLVLESTYGNRRHNGADTREEIAAAVNRAVARGGVIVVPSFAVGRAQLLLWHIHELKAARRIPDLPVYLNSPMAADVTHVYEKFHDEHRLTPVQAAAMCRTAKIVNTVAESKALNTLQGSAIIIAGSGMATGGRVIHHLKAYAPEKRNTILLTGFQAGGTRGASLLRGADTLKIHGEQVPVRAEVVVLDNVSAHADYAETLDWLGHFRKPPRRTFLTHGEPEAADALRLRIEERLKWRVEVPEYLERVALDENQGMA
jgi:metallo-beta-lactamase family protein